MLLQWWCLWKIKEGGLWNVPELRFSRGPRRLPKKGLNNVFLLLCTGREKNTEEPTLSPTESESIPESLSWRLPRGYQEVTLLLSQGSFLRNKKKKAELIGTISVGTQRNSWTQILRLEKIWRESTKDWGITGKSFHRNAVLESIFPIWFQNQKMPKNDATDRKCFQSTPFPPWALGAAKGVFIVATNQGTRSCWHVWSLQRFWSQSYAKHTHRGQIHLWNSHWRSISASLGYKPNNKQPY